MGEEQDTTERLFPHRILNYASVQVHKSDIPAIFSTKHNFGLSPQAQLYLLTCLIFLKGLNIFKDSTPFSLGL